MKLLYLMLLMLVAVNVQAKDFIIGIDTSKMVTCTNATTRVDGSPLAVSDIERVEVDITNETLTYTITMMGGCQPMSFDLTQLSPGTWNHIGRTYDTDGRESVGSAPVPFGYVKSTALPNPPIVTP